MLFVRRLEVEEMALDGKTKYLNTDLDLRSSDELTALAAALESAGVSPLHVTRGEDGLWYATFTTDDIFEEPNINIARMLDAVDALAPEHRAIWSRCDLKEFNIGYDCGDEPWAFNQGLSSEVLARMAAATASLRWTLYPVRSNIAEE